MKSKLLMPYAPTLIESTRSIGYSAETAVADIIDNSIAADANKIEISFLYADDPFIAILDNGSGMNGEGLDRAMQFGSFNPLDERSFKDLGRYGLGLKTASLSQCRRLTVISKQGEAINGREWDLDYIAETGNWSLQILEEEDMVSVPEYKRLLNLTSGTLVVWRTFDRMVVGETEKEEVFDKKLLLIQEHLSLVFHRYLSGESDLPAIEIFFNHRPIKPKDPFLREKSLATMQPEPYKIRNSLIEVQTFLLPHVSDMTEEDKKVLGGLDGIRNNQGFYIYRNKRLLIGGKWFGMNRKGKLYELSRIRVDIPNDLDDLWSLDIKKSQAVPPESVKRILRSVVSKITGESRKTTQFRGKREMAQDSARTWKRMKNRDNKVFYEIDRESEMISSFIKKYPSAKKELFRILKDIEFSLPIQQLTMDLNENEVIHPDTPEDCLNLIRDAIETLSPQEKEDYIRNIIEKYPFSKYRKEIISNLHKEGLIS